MSTKLYTVGCASSRTTLAAKDYSLTTANLSVRFITFFDIFLIKIEVARKLYIKKQYYYNLFTSNQMLTACSYKLVAKHFVCVLCLCSGHS